MAVFQFSSFCLLLAALVSLADGQCTQTSACSCTSSSGVIDLKPLDHPNSPILWQQPGSVWSYQINPCTGFTCNAAQNQAICESYPSASISYGIGNANSAKFGYDASNGYSISYTEDPYSSKLMLICDPTQEGKIIDGPNGPAGSEYTFKLVTKYCCLNGAAGGSGGLSAGSVMLIIFFSLLAAYLIGGVLFMHFVKHESGVNLIPNHQFWIQVPGQIRDGCVLTYSTIMTLINRARGNSGYEAV